MEAPDLNQGALLALLDQAPRAEAVTDAPPEADEHGWMAPAASADNGFRKLWCSGGWRCCQMRR